MEFFIDNPNIERLPPEATRIIDIRVESYPDGVRLRVSLELTPFQVRPMIEIVVADDKGTVLGSTSVIEPQAWKQELTMHLRAKHPPNQELAVTASLSYPEIGIVDQRAATVTLESGGR
ncbi:MAG: hypothetical protein ABIJ39_10930 [Chloroflexota bacterium]